MGLVGSRAQAQKLWRTGLVAPWHVGSSRTRARTCVPCIGRRILNHCATREIPIYLFLFSFFWPYCMACRILALWPGIEPRPSAVKAQSPNHWTTREFPYILFYILFHYGLPQDIEYSSILYSRSSLFIHSICNSSHLPIQNCHSTPPPAPLPPWQLQVCSLRL